MSNKIKIATITEKELFKKNKPLYNGYACGYGPHGSKKYDRNKEKRKFENLKNE